jgi:predicted nuclease of predicted toxin-antitoxin system
LKFKLDENFGNRTQKIFELFGYDVQTVRAEALQGAPDQILYEICCQEQHCLVTLDLDFADVIRFPPQKIRGIVVIRVPKNPSLSLLEKMVQQLLQKTIELSPESNLWIVEAERIRIHQNPDN